MKYLSPRTTTRLCCAILVLLQAFSGFIPFALAATNTSSFSSASDYTYDSTKIEFSGGQAQLTATSSPAWYSSSWTKRKAITITGSSAGAQTNYQLKITVPYDADMQADFDDIRFTSSDGTTLVDHWIESKTDSSTADFWVEIPSIPASPSTVAIYMYYGNSSASSASSGANTLNYFDDFESDTLGGSPSGWTSESGSAALVQATSNKPAWTRNASNPVIALGTAPAWDSGRILEPSIVKVGSVYYLFYSGYITTSSGDAGWDIGLATSTDGVSWTKYASNPVINDRWETGVVYVGGTFYLYASASPTDGNVYLYTSTNGTTWTSQGSVFSKSSIREFDMYYESGNWYLYFGYIYNSTNYAIGCATSTNGTSFTECGSNPLITSSAPWEAGGDIESPSVFKLWDGSTYTYALSYIGFTSGTPKPWNNGFAFSDTLTSGWTKYTINPQLSPVTSNAWENVKAAETDSILVGSNIYMYYSGGDSTTNQIGLATMSQSDFSAFFDPIISNRYLSITSTSSENNIISKTYPSTLSTGGRVGMKFTDDTSINSIGGLWLYTGSGSNYFSISVRRSSSATKYSYHTADGTWTVSTVDRSSADHTLEILYDGTAYKGKIDGTQIFSYSTTTAPQTIKLMNNPELGATNGSYSYDNVRASKYVASEPTYSIGSEVNIYASDNPTIQPSASVTYTSLSGFAETSTLNGGAIGYQVSNDGGTTWYWYNSGWATTTSGYTEANTSSQINSNIATLPAGSGSFTWRAYLHSDGTQLVKLDAVDLTYANETSSPAPSSSSASTGSGTPAPYPTAPSGGFTASADGTVAGNKITLHFGFGTDITSVALADNIAFAPAQYIPATSSLEWTVPANKKLFVRYCNIYARCSDPILLTVSASPSLPSSASGKPDAYEFSKNLFDHMTHPDVAELQKYLNAHGFTVAQSGAGSAGFETNYFGQMTHAALVRFQETYAGSILAPFGLKKGTGYFGPSTRAFVNKQ